ncbi:uncharacterized protein LOC143212571 [Lasioglossum baleicum]|uniref:uncharacterized protein LOC143212571 n=1 Tax=Lasioglossum baleicum TaxID=434251 RepID=UPI003FCCB306
MTTYHHKDLNILFWNPRSILRRKEELPNILINLDILICVESWLSEESQTDKNFHFAGFKTFRKDRLHSRGGGILILIRNNLAYFELQNLKCPDQSVELAGIKITNINPAINIFVCYRAPHSTLSQSQWDEIVTQVDKSQHAILMGDFNAHHTSWNCKNNDTNGERLFNSYNKSDLFLHNSKSITYVQFNNDIRSNLDLIFSSANIAHNINVEVIDETWGSDHYPLFVTVSTKKITGFYIYQCIRDTKNSINHIYAANNHNNDVQEYYSFISNIYINTEFGSFLTYVENPNILIENLIKEEKSYALYTDGSKSKNSVSVGTACVCNDLDITVVRSLTKNASIFTAESIALNDAVKIALNYPNQNFLIFTDSLSALLSLQQPIINTKTNPYILEIRKNVFKFASETSNDSKIKFYWVPAHSGILGNETADALAKSAANTVAASSIKIPFTDLRESAKSVATQNTYNTIEKEGLFKGVNYFTHFHNRKSKPWFSHTNLQREIITTVNRCRSGHYNLASSLFRIGFINDPKCHCGYESQDIDHVLWQCPTFDEQRLEFIKQLQKLHFFLPLSCNVLFSRPTVELCKISYSFLKACDLKV